MDSSPEVFTKEEGLRLLKAGQLDDAIRILEKVRDKSDDPQLCSYLGAAYTKKGDKMNAIHAFEESLRLQETPKAYFNLALVYESVGRIDEAVREYRMATEMDPGYAPAQEALARLHSQFEGVQPQTATATQVMAPGAPAASQTQAFSGPPPGPAVGQAPAPVGDPFARSYGPPPTQADIMAKQMVKEQEIADQHHRLMKNGIIYGAICGAIFFILLSLMGTLMVTALGGRGWLYMVINGLIGAGYGSLVGLWIGHTCGGDGAGFQAGAVLGAIYGLVLGLIAGSAGLAIGMALIDGLLSGLVGWIIGRMVEMSIQNT